MQLGQQSGLTLQLLFLKGEILFTLTRWIQKFIRIKFKVSISTTQKHNLSKLQTPTVWCFWERLSLLNYHTNDLYKLYRYCVRFFQTFVPREEYKETVQLTNGQKDLMDRGETCYRFSYSEQFLCVCGTAGPSTVPIKVYYQIIFEPVQSHAHLQNQILSHPLSCYPWNSTKWA